MRYAQPYGTADDSPYVNGNPATGTAGSIPPAEAFEDHQRELVNFIEKSGFTPTHNDLYQIIRSVRSQYVNYFVDVGTADLLQVAGDPTITAYNAGLTLRVKKAAAANLTTTPQINAGAGFATIVRADGTAVLPGDLASGMMMVLVYDGTYFRIVSSGGGLGSQNIAEAAAFPLKTIYYPSGLYLFTVPANVRKVRAWVWAGGGSGGNGLASTVGGAGGGAGGFALKNCDVSPGQEIVVTVGAGGTGRPAGYNLDGLAGGASSFGAFCSASGGGYGERGISWSNPGTPTYSIGGIGTGGDINLRGGWGGSGAGGLKELYAGDGERATALGGIGGNAPWGGGSGGYMSTGSGADGVAPGGGGSGGGGNSGISAPSGAGADGMVIVEYVSLT